MLYREMFKLLWQNVEAVFTVITPKKYFTQLLYSYIAFNKRNAVTDLKFASPCFIIQFEYINQLDATTSQVYYLT
jgi:hypothetical protein